ncbi:hypothetical protein QR685DRAFT_600156 [Neurospora intermedia]|uniref:Uncharacterized protein n=1 Tax=Neurospora intermedia TaxID=5142 RepID=A0ABR3D277_NEUIN
MDESRIRYGLRNFLCPGRQSSSTSLLISPKIRDPSGEQDQPGRAFYRDISVFVLHQAGAAVISEMHEDGDGLLERKVRKRSKQPASRAVTDGTSRR